MALAHTLKASGAEDQASDSEITSAAFSATSGAVLVVIMAALNFSGTGTPTISDSEGLSWTQQKNVDATFGSWSSHINIWTASVLSNVASMTVTVDSDAGDTSSSAFIGVTVHQFIDQHSVTPFPQTFDDSDTSGRSGSYSSALSQSSESDSIVLAACVSDNDPWSSPTLDVGSGWASVYENDVGGRAYMLVESYSGTTANVVYASLDADFSWVVCAIEIAAVAAAGTLPVGNGLTESNLLSKGSYVR
jgi:hypothetical protein